MNIVLVHGWGSGTFVWKEILPKLEKQHNCYCVNLGFLGEEDFTLPEGDFIGIGHSLGGQWLLQNHPERLKGFVSIASFNCFYKYIPQQILDSMGRNIVKDSLAQVNEFWHHAGLDKTGGFKNLKPVKLLEGLSWLSKLNPPIPENLPIKILASHDDVIVPERMSKKVWKDHKIEWIDTGGHMLPLTQPEWCTAHIESFIDELK